MHSLKTFGRAASLGAAPAAPAPASPPVPEAVPSCVFTHYLGDEGRVGTSDLSYGTQAAIVSALLVGGGWLLGGVIPVVGRPVGSLVGAGVAGAATYAGYSSWKTRGGTAKKPGSCP